MLREPTQLRAVQPFQLLSDRFLGTAEFGVSAFFFLQALDIGTELVRSLHQGFFRTFRLADKIFIGETQLLGNLGEQGGNRLFFHGVVALSGVLIKVFDGRGQVARVDLGNIVEEGQKRCLPFIIVFSEDPVSHNRKTMGNNGHLRGVFGKVFRLDIAHQPPALDIFLAENQSKKTVLFHRIPLFQKNTTPNPL